MINKRKSFERYNDFIERVGRGGYWVNQFDQFIPIFQLLAEYTSIQVPVWGLNEWLKMSWGYDTGITFIHILTFVVIKHYLKTFIIPYFLGKFDEKWGLWKYSNEYKSKKEHIAPWQVEVSNQLKEYNRVFSKVTGEEVVNHIKDL